MATAISGSKMFQFQKYERVSALLKLNGVEYVAAICTNITQVCMYRGGKSVQRILTIS